MDPTCSLCQGNLGSAIANSDSGLERLDEAEGHLRQAIALRPDNAIPYFNLGGLLMTRKRYDEAGGGVPEVHRAVASPAAMGSPGSASSTCCAGAAAEAIPLLEQATGASSGQLGSGIGPKPRPPLLPEAIALGGGRFPARSSW